MMLLKVSVSNSLMASIFRHQLLCKLCGRPTFKIRSKISFRGIKQVIINQMFRKVDKTNDSRMTANKGSLVNITFIASHANEVCSDISLCALALPVNNAFKIITLRNNCDDSYRVDFF